jgi:hypothetical protein
MEEYRNMVAKIKVLIARIILLLLCWMPILLGTEASKASDDPLINNKTSLLEISPKAFLPLVKNQPPLLVGIYPDGKIDQSTFDNELKPLDSWVSGITEGHSTSIYGTFIIMDVNKNNAYANVELPLITIWNNGYTPFINLPGPDSATSFDIAAGKYDSELSSWARSYKNFANGGARFAYIAPLQEMNGYWVTYGKDPGNFIIAYRHIQNIFTQEGVPAQSVRWVFAPNGWSEPGSPRFEDYYPGDAYVDVVAISAYNWGYCQGAVWEEPETVYNNPALGTTYGHYLDRLRALAPSKPIFIAETASSSYRSIGVQDYSEKDRWLKDAYLYLSAQPNVKAVLYFNGNKECDWAIFIKDSVQFAGYRTGVIANGYGYIPPAELLLMR